MYLVAIAWMYVVLMMAIAEALAPQGTILGALFTFVSYGLVPLGLVLYIMGTPLRKRRARRLAAAESSAEHDGSREPPGHAIAAKREEPAPVLDRAPGPAADRNHPGGPKPAAGQGRQIGQPRS